MGHPPPEIVYGATWIGEDLFWALFFVACCALSPAVSTIESWIVFSPWVCWVKVWLDRLPECCAVVLHLLSEGLSYPRRQAFALGCGRFPSRPSYSASIGYLLAPLSSRRNCHRQPGRGRQLDRELFLRLGSPSKPLYFHEPFLLLFYQSLRARQWPLLWRDSRFLVRNLSPLEREVEVILVLVWATCIWAW